MAFRSGMVLLPRIQINVKPLPPNFSVSSWHYGPLLVQRGSSLERVVVWRVVGTIIIAVCIVVI